MRLTHRSHLVASSRFSLLSAAGAALPLLAVVACSDGAEPDGVPFFGNDPGQSSAGGTSSDGTDTTTNPNQGTSGTTGTGANSESTEVGGNPSDTTDMGNNGSNDNSGSMNDGAGGTGSEGTAGTASVGGSMAMGGSAPLAMGGSDMQGQAGTNGAEPPPDGFYFVDDFEGGRNPLWTESEVGGGAGNFTLDTSLGANGSSSSIRIDSNNAFHTMLQVAIPQAAREAGEIYGRVFLRLAQDPSGAHYIWVELGTEANDGHEMRLGHNVGQLQSNHWLNGEQDIRDQERALVGNQWYCLEFYMANNPDELRVWLDGEETNLSTTNYTAGPGAQGNGNPIADFIPELDAFRIGWELQNGTVWFDDVALSASQVGCQ